MSEHLRELSALLEIEVTDARHTLVVVGGRWGDGSPAAWRLKIPTAAGGLDSAEWVGEDGWTLPFRSAKFRNTWDLRWLVSTWLGREARHFTKADGRRALSLLHKHIAEIEKEKSA